MAPGRFLTATVAAGIALFVAGYVIWPLSLAGFMDGHLGSAEGVSRANEDVNFLFLALSQFVYAAFLTLTVGSWGGRRGFGPGFSGGALVGLLSGLATALLSYATANILDLTGHIVDGLAMAVWAGIGGGVVGLVLARGEKVS